jgi:hypothetical protein
MPFALLQNMDCRGVVFDWFGNRRGLKHSLGLTLLVMGDAAILATLGRGYFQNF